MSGWQKLMSLVILTVRTAQYCNDKAHHGA